MVHGFISENPQPSVKSVYHSIVMVNVTSPSQEDLFFSTIVDSYISNPRFLRRNWLAVEVEELLRNAECRYLLMTAAPGAGKSAFIAQLAHDHPTWPVYFIRRDQRIPLGDIGAHSFLLRIGYQLAALYPELFTPEAVKLVIEQRIGTVDESGEAIGAEVKRVIASPFYQQIVRIRQQVERNEGNIVGLRVGEWVVDPRLIPLSDLQYLALIDPATSLLALRPQETIVILVDALDELRYHHSDQTLLQWLTNCPQLPRNVRFVLTARPLDQMLIAFSEKQRLYLQTLALKARGDRVEKDLEIYVRRLVNEPTVAASLERMGQDQAEFSTRALAKANDNIGYLDALARGIDQTVSSGNEQALRELLSLQSLPDHLEGLYAFFLRQVRAAVDKQSVEVEDAGDVHYVPAWPAVYRRVLGVLAVAREPQTIDQIKLLGGIAANEDYLDEAINQLLQFLQVVDGHHRFYHASVAEFLTSPETRGNPETKDFYVDPIHWHSRIADYYWKVGQDNWQGCDDYGLNHLAMHLFESQQCERLQTLISKEWMEARYAGGGYSYKGFLDDVNLARQAELASRDYDVVTLVRLQTARQAVTQQVSLYTDVDLKTLVWLGRKHEALAHARLRTEPEERTRGLLSISDALRGREQPDIDLLNEAEEVVSTIPYDQPRAEALRDLAVALAQAGESRAREVFAQAEETARAITNDWKRDEALGYVAAALAQAGYCAEAEETARAITNDQPLAWALSNLAAALAKAGECRAREVFAQAQETARAIPYIQPRVEALINLAAALAKAGYFAQAEERALTIWSDWARAEALSYLAASLAQAGESRARELFAQAEETARAITDDGNRAVELSNLAASLAQAGESRAREIFAQAEEAARAITDNGNRAEVLSYLAASLAKAGNFVQAEEAAHTITDDGERARALRDLAAAMAKAGESRARELFVQANERARAITDDGKRVEALRGLAVALAEAGESRARELFGRAEETARAITDDRERAEGLSQLTAALAKAGHFAQAEETAHAITDDVKRARALRDLAAAMAKAGESRAREVFAQAGKMARAITDDWQRAEALSYLTASLGQAGHFEEAEETARAITDDRKRGEALSYLTAAQAQAGHFAQAEETARAITDDRKRASALSDLAASLVQAGHFAQGEEMAFAIKDDVERAWALRDLAAAMAKAGENRARELFAQAEETARAITDDGNRVVALRLLAASLLQAGESRAMEVFAQAEEAARAITDEGQRAWELMDLAASLAQAGESRAKEAFAQAEEEARAITDDGDRAVVLSQLAAAHAQTGDFAQAEETARAITGDRERAEALRDLAVSLAKAGESRATEIFTQAEERARAITDDGDRALALSNLATALAHSSLFDQALITLGSRSLSEFLQALASWAPAFELQKTGLSVAVLGEATRVAGWVSPEWRKIHELLSSEGNK